MLTSQVDKSLRLTNNFIRCYIGLGSNIANPVKQVTSALDELDKLPQTRLIKASRLYQTPPMGPADQPDFVNAVAAIDSQLRAEKLLAEIKKIERKHKRIFIRHWGPRTLDLDLLLYGNLEINSANLVVPHPGLLQRSFVLYPLLEIEPDICLPNGEQIKNYLFNLTTDNLLAVSS